jgi:nuclear GTP-binding protein
VREPKTLTSILTDTLVVSKSKRQPVRLRHKIEKASAAKQRKQRKESKKVRFILYRHKIPLTMLQNPQWKSRLKKDPGIPNLFPYKDKILEEIEEKKRRKAEEAERLRDVAKAKKQQARKDLEAEVDEDIMDEDDDLLEEEDDEMNDTELPDSSNPMAALLASAQARATDYDGDMPHGDVEDSSEDEEGGVQVSEAVATDYRNPDSSRKAFDKIFKQVLEAADVILYVLDARDPDGTRSREVEREIMAAASGSKRLILVLNKIDLVPPQVLKGWLTHLRRYFPTVPLRASTPASNAHTFDHKQLTLKNTSETLLRSLKSYAASKNLKRSISVGVIGYPNVGKSSVINALTSRLSRGQSSACPTGAEAGVTTSLREVKVDSKLKILDSPGIVFPSSVDGDDRQSKQKKKAEHEARLVLLNALPPSQMSDPLPAISLLLERLSLSEALYAKLFEYYGITALGPFGGDTQTDFLVQVARKRGRLGKGGVPNLSSAAMAVITDWRDGRIQGWVEPPTLQIATDEDMGGEAEAANANSGDRKEIVKEWAAEFKLDGLWGDNGADADAMQK